MEGERVAGEARVAGLRRRGVPAPEVFGRDVVGAGVEGGPAGLLGLLGLVAPPLDRGPLPYQPWRTGLD